MFVGSADFGGASVTIPLKERVMPLLDELSEAAKRIGAVNTIIRTPAGSAHSTLFFTQFSRHAHAHALRTSRLRGDNTDWQGIVEPLQPLLQRSAESRELKDSTWLAIVIGAGGTARAACFAMNQVREIFASTRISLSCLSSLDLPASNCSCSILALPRTPMN